MDDTEARKLEIDMKLERETKNLALLQESLRRSNTMTSNMMSILKSFDQRLGKLEESITPVYLETGNLQRRQENIEKTFVTLDHVIDFYHIAKDSERTIRDSPSNGLENYLKTMDKLQRALIYFSSNSPGSPEYTTVNHLFDVGRESTEKEFKNLLARHSKPVFPATALSAINNEQDDELKVRLPGISIEHLLSERVIEDLKVIVKWLRANNSRDIKFVSEYALTRSNNLCKSLKSLRDHVRSSSTNSGGSLNSQSSPSSKARKDTPARRVKRTPSNFARKSGVKVKEKKNFDQSIKRTPSSNVAVEEPQTEMELESYLVSISALLKLVQSEKMLLQRIIPEQFQRDCLAQVIHAAVDIIVTEGENVAHTATKSVTKHDCPSLITVFPVIKHLRNLRSEFDVTLQGCSEPKDRLCSLQVLLDTTGARSMEGFIENIKNDSDKQSNMPTDGTVHELTSNVIMFLSQLVDFAETAGAMLMKQDTSKLSTNEIKHRYRSKLSEYLTKVLSALGLNLNNKADGYNETTLRSIFMLNNNNYILKSLKRNELLEIITINNPDIELLYNEKILEQKKMYSTSWTRVLHYINEVHKTLPLSQDGGKIKDRERQNIKDRFTGFNKEIEDICRTQKGYAIPDMELREALIHENKQFIAPVYKRFYDKYATMNFTKNPEKYVRYTVDDVASRIDQFFDSTA